MDENRTDYEPNFIMRDSTEDQSLPGEPYASTPFADERADAVTRTAPQTETGAPAGTHETFSTGESPGTDESAGSGQINPSSEQTRSVPGHTYSATWTSRGHSSNRGFNTSRNSNDVNKAGGNSGWNAGNSGGTGSNWNAGNSSDGNTAWSTGSNSGSQSDWRNDWNSGRKTRRKPSPAVTLTRRTLGLLVAGCLVISALFGFGSACIGNNLWNNGTENAPAVSSTASSTKTSGYNLEDATGSNLTVKEITEATQSSVVEIKTESAAADSWLQNYVTEGAGSGVIISDDGYIMTNNHVVSGANKITVTTIDKKSYEAALVGTDSTNDVAVIKIKASGLKPVTYGNSNQLQVGDLAVAIGNPLGELGGTVTAGIISATDRQLNIDGTTMTLLQTDSSINPGNSGGGLFNGDGQLVGLVVAKSSGSDVEGLGFAIPVNKAADVAQQLMKNGYVTNQPCTGMTYTEGSSGFDAFFGADSGTVYIYSVDSTTARLAGFKAGDIVYAIDGEEISSIDDISGVVTSHKVGDKVKFTILREGQAKDITLKLQEKTKEQQEQQNAQN